MDNLINETNSKLQEIIDNLTTIKSEYESKLEANANQIDSELAKVKKYKEDFFTSKQKVEKMNDDITGFEEDYKNLVERFKDDELANILIAANKEISAKIDERKRKIAKDKIAMNGLVEKAESSKNRLVKLTAEKKALELCLTKILDAHEFYTKSLQQIINYSEDNRGNLSACFYEKSEDFSSVAIETQEAIENTCEENDSIQFEDKYITEDDDNIEIDEDFEKEEIEDLQIDEEIEETEEYENYIENDNISDVVNNISDDINDIENTFVEEDIEEDLDDEEIDSVESVDIDDLEIDEDDDENPNNVEEIEETTAEEADDYENENIIEGDEHTIVMDEIPSESYDFNDNLDLENVINFDDSLEDDETLYNEKENEE